EGGIVTIPGRESCLRSGIGPQSESVHDGKPVADVAIFGLVHLTAELDGPGYLIRYLEEIDRQPDGEHVASRRQLAANLGQKLVLRTRMSRTRHLASTGPRSENRGYGVGVEDGAEADQRERRSQGDRHRHDDAPPHNRRNGSRSEHGGFLL